MASDDQVEGQELDDRCLQAIESLVLAVDLKDQGAHSHLLRVRAYAEGMATLCGIKDASELVAIRAGALLHDIGKLAVDDYILNKPGRLTAQEFEKMKMHALAGHEIVEQIRLPFPAAAYVRGHHERWDGSGYPDGLKEECIPLGARILAIADAFDAMRSWRPYKSSLSMRGSLEELRTRSGTVFDPRLVDLFVSNIDLLESRAVAVSVDSRGISSAETADDIRRSTAGEARAPHRHPLAPSTTGELVSFYEFCTGPGPHLELQDLYGNLAQRIGRLVPYSLCAFWAVDEDAAICVEHAAGKRSDMIQAMTGSLGKGISGWVAAYRQPMMNTTAAIEFHGSDFDAEPLRDSLVVPLMCDGYCIGTISLYAEKPLSYSQEHLGLLQIVARQAASIIAVARENAASRRERQHVSAGAHAYHAPCPSFVAGQLIADAGARGARLPQRIEPEPIPPESPNSRMGAWRESAALPIC